jgi:hypothetical protein
MQPRPLTLLLAVVACAPACAAADAGTNGIAYRPADSVPRVQGGAERAPDVGPIIDFAAHSGQLYLLNGLGRVTVVTHTDSGWATAFEFAREGDGPGELRYPISIAAGRDVIAVTEPARLQLFDTAGELRSTRALAPPCPMMRPSIAFDSGRVYLFGDCLRTGLRTDTTVAILAVSADTAVFTEIAREVRYTRNGDVGNVFNLAPAFSTGRDGDHLFGVGTRNCVWLIRAAQPHSLCPAVHARYRAEPPQELRRRLQRVRTDVHIEWPAVLPPYVERVAVAGSIVLVRPFSADSIVLQLAAPDARDLAVAPLERLVRCNAHGCLWVFEDGTGTKLLHLDTAALEDLVRTR